MRSNGSDRDSWKVSLWDRGFLAWPRGMENSPFWQNPRLLKVLLWVLSKANYKEKWLSIPTGKGPTEVHIRPGEFVYGRKTASKQLKIPETTLRRYMNKLAKYGVITIKQADVHYSIVTVLDYYEYQYPKKRSGHPRLNGQAKIASSGQANNTHNDKKNKQLHNPIRETRTPNINVQWTPNGRPTDTENKDKKDNNSLSERKNNSAEQIANLLRDLLRERDRISEEPDLETWIKAIETILRHGRRPEEINRVIRWALNDHHWKKVIVGTDAASKLLKHYDQLKMRLEDTEPEEREMSSTYSIGKECDFQDIQSVNEIIWGIQGGDERQLINSKKLLRKLAPGFTDLERDRVILEIEKAGNIADPPRLYLKKLFDKLLNERHKTPLGV